LYNIVTLRVALLDRRLCHVVHIKVMKFSVVSTVDDRILVLAVCLYCFLYDVMKRMSISHKLDCSRAMAKVCDSTSFCSLNVMPLLVIVLALLARCSESLPAPQARILNQCGYGKNAIASKLTS